MYGVWVYGAAWCINTTVVWLFGVHTVCHPYNKKAVVWLYICCMAGLATWRPYNKKVACRGENPSGKGPFRLAYAPGVSHSTSAASYTTLIHPQTSQITALALFFPNMDPFRCMAVWFAVWNSTLSALSALRARSAGDLLKFTVGTSEY